MSMPEEQPKKEKAVPGQADLIRRRAQKIAFGSTIQERIAEIKKLVYVSQFELNRVMESANEEFSLIARVKELMSEEIKILLHYLRYNRSVDELLLRKALKIHRTLLLALERLPITAALLTMEEMYHNRKRVLNSVRYHREKRIKYLQTLQFQVLYEAEKILHPDNEEEMKMVMSYYSKASRMRGTLITAQRINSKYHSILNTLKTDSREQPSQLRRMEKALCIHQKELHHVAIVFRHAVAAQEEAMTRWKEEEEEVKKTRSWRDEVKQQFISYELSVKAQFEEEGRRLAQVVPYHVGPGRNTKEFRNIFALEEKDGYVVEKILGYEDSFDKLRDVTHGINYKAVLEELDKNQDVDKISLQAQCMSQLRDELISKLDEFSSRKESYEYELLSLREELNKREFTMKGQIYELKQNVRGYRVELERMKQVVVDSGVGVTSLLLVLMDNKAAGELKSQITELHKKKSHSHQKQQDSEQTGAHSKASPRNHQSKHRMRSSAKRSTTKEDQLVHEGGHDAAPQGDAEEGKVVEPERPTWVTVLEKFKLCTQLVEELKAEVDEQNSTDGRMNHMRACLDRLDPNETYHLNAAKLRINLLARADPEEQLCVQLADTQEWTC